MELPEYTKECGLHVIECGLETPIVDIIAVHGLAANPEYTWIKRVPDALSAGVGRLNESGEREVVWLKHLLPAVVPNARILKYNYDSQWFNNAPKESLRSIGDRLIRGIHLERENLGEGGSRRPIIFIGHSFGGIVIEEVLLHANRSERHRGIPLSTCGVIFLGTPFRGSSASSWGVTIANCASVMGFSSEKQLLKTLEEGSERLDILVNDFTIMAKEMDMKLVCFYELYATKKRKLGVGINTIIVDKRSATVDGYNPISLPMDHSGMNKFGSSKDESFQLVSSEIKNLVNRAYDFLHSAEKSSRPYLLATRAVEDYELSKDWLKLPCAEGAAYNHRVWEHEDQCLPETRIQVRQQIMGWSEDAKGAYIFWLNGMAGTGKSTISRTIASDLDKKGRLAASFFFSRGRGDIGHAGKFFTTIATQLASRLPVLRPPLSKAIKQDFDISQQGLREQWERLILEPLSSLKGTGIRPAAMIIVIDALDECEKEEDMQLILALLAQAKCLHPIRLQVFITSRPETPILLGFRRLPGDIHQDFVLHDISLVIVNQDIATFFQHKFALVKADHDGLSTPWPDEQVIQELVRRAAGLFIYAATTYRFIRITNYDPEEQLSLVLQESNNSTSPTKELDSMYTQVLRHSVIDRRDNEVDQELLNRFRQSVGSIVIMFDVMAAKDLAALLHLSPRTVKRTFSSLRSLLNVPENEDQPIRTLHPSFRDFLLNRDRCFDSRFWIDEKEKHIDIFCCCLELMSNKLRRDICNLRTAGTTASELSQEIIQNAVSPDLRYACRYWVSHFQRGKSTMEVQNRVLQFLNTHFLHWLEVLGLIGEVPEGVLMVTALEAHLLERGSVCRELSELAYDAKRFILFNRSMIETAPLQVYYSALLFCPRRSVIRRKYKREDPWVLKEPMVIEEWSPLIQTLEGHEDPVRAAEFSPDGKLLASASDDYTVQLWDTSTGASRGVLEGHLRAVNGVVFSPDGKLLASASDDKTVRLWDASTGGSCGVLEGHSDTVDAVTFSPDGKLVASGSGDNTVRLWDTSRRGPHGILQGHSGGVKDVEFSPDGKLVASASRDNTVRLWDTTTGWPRGVLEGHSGVVNTVVFSPNGNLVASASDDCTVRLWGASSGSSCRVLTGHSDAVRAVEFSPNGMVVASASNDGTVRLWDTSAGDSCVVLEGHTDDATAVVFSPDGRLVASASSDETVRLWGASTGEPHGVLVGHSDEVRAVVFSPDGRLVASTSIDETVRLWETSEGSSGVLEGHSSTVTTAVIPPHESFVPSASNEDRVQLCDTSIEASRWVLEGHSLIVNEVVFSPAGNLVASASDDGTVRLWDSSGGSCGVLVGHSDAVRAVVFSPDGELVASASSDETVRLWDTSTGGSRGVLVGHSDYVTAVVFSGDGKLIASASSDKTVRLWDRSTGRSRGILTGHSDEVAAVTFSPDGKLVASASHDDTVRLWDPSTGVSRGVLEGHSHWVHVVAFSPDGKLLASASFDKTVRLWDLTEKSMVEQLDTGRGIRSIQFSGHGVQIQTYQGSLMLAYSMDSSNPGQASKYPSLDITDHWITCNMRNLIWLPWDYLPRSFAVHGSCLALGLPSGHVSLISLDPATTSRDFPPLSMLQLAQV